MYRNLACLLLLAFVLVGSTQAQFISAVAHRNTDSDALEPPEIAPNPLDEDELVFVDRTHQYNEIPAYLIGAQYVLTANDNKNMSAYELDLVMSSDATVYVFVDNRMGGSAGGLDVDPIITGMGWLNDRGFVDTGDDMGIDESGDGDIDQYSSVFAKAVKAGETVTIGGNAEGHGGNMLSVAAQGPKLQAYDPAPEDGAVHMENWISANWTTGDSAVSHDVYFSDIFDDVNDGTADAFVGNQTGNSVIAGFVGFPYPDGLANGSTYYWRIDEVEADGTTHRGNVWSFWIPPVKAYEPAPADGAKFVTTDIELSWTAGFGAKLHVVYFGDDLDTVTNATDGQAQTATTFSPGALASQTTYYWRVDELNPPITHKGDVWSFSTVPDIPIADPSLLCWWKLDEEAGSVALDHSGHGQHGTLEGDTKWVDGVVSGALEFDGTADRVVDETAASYLNDLDAITVCLWAKSDLVGTDEGFINCEEPDGSDSFVTMRYDSAGGNGGGTNVLKMAVTSTEGEQQLESSSNSQTTEWQHMAMAWASGQQLQFYINGVLNAATDNYAATTGTTTGCTKLVIGAGAKDASGGWDGLIDDVRIYDKVLTAEEIQQVMLGDTKQAGSPVPDRSALVDIRDISSLSWSKGDTATSHDVYFGQDRDAVAEADNSSPQFQGNQAGTSLSLAGLVEFGGGDYCWRVDEIEPDGTAIAGTLWKFTVPDYLIVEDFESYNDIEEDQPGSNRIYLTWIDGFGTTTNGALAGNLDPPFMSQGRDSVQAMPLSYDNAGKTSEATMTLASKKDWTEHGVTKLVVWFNGDSANAAERMFVAVGNATVYHPDAAVTQTGAWTEWVVDLADFAGQGANLSNVPSITIGFGTKGAPVATGGAGTVHFDDIRLY